MPRNARRQSANGIYHIMVRGNERKDIFYNDEDRRRFLEILMRMRENGKYVIYAYCLMKNHVHLLMHEGEEPLQRSMKRIGISYAYYFNRKYNRVGHLFQDRFRSEAVEEDTYLLAASRYIHNNPVRAGVVEKPEDYKWSSYRVYIDDDLKNGNSLVEQELLLSMLSDSKQRAIELFKEFTSEYADDNFIDIEDGRKKIEKRNTHNDLKGQALSVLKRYGYSFESLKQCKDKMLRNSILKEIKQNINISVRELSRFTGISKDIIFRA